MGISELTPREKHVLHLLARGHTYDQIKETLRISGSCLHAHTSNLRRKTGIRDTGSKLECSRYLLHDFSAQPASYAAPTKTQVKILRKIIFESKNYRQVAEELGLAIGTVMNAVSQARKRVPMGGLSGSAKKAEAELRKYLESVAPKAKTTFADPMDDPCFS